MDEVMLERLTKMGHATQNQKLRLFAKVDMKTKLKVLERQKSLFHKLKSLYTDADNAMLTLASLILVVDNVAKELGIVNINALKLQGKSVRQKTKRDRLLRYWAIIRTLKLEKNMSFRQVAQYLKKYHKLDVAHSTVYELWSELEVKKISENGEK